MTASATTSFRRQLARILALAGAATLGCVTLALAQPGTTLSSTINGTASGAGRISRTIIDAQPNGKTQSTNYPVGYTSTNGQTPAQIAQGYRDSLNVYLGSAGFKAYFSPTYTTNNVRLTKQANTTFTATAETNTAPSVTFQPRTLTVEDAPMASPWLLASLLAGFTTLAWWMRRRRRTA
jgi:hypothetical protein